MKCISSPPRIFHPTMMPHIKFLTANRMIKGSILLLLILMILFPHASYQGASTGLMLWFHNVLPNLLPFIIVSNLIIRFNITRQLSIFFYPFFKRIFHVSKDGCYPILIGFLSGIPMGAKSSADLVSQHKITQREGQFLLTMCNNASPMFIIGYIAITQLQVPQIKYYLFAILYASAILSALIYRWFDKTFSKHPDELALKKEPKAHLPQQLPVRFSFDLLDSAIMNGFEVVTKIGGYIILFSILAQIVSEAISGMGFMKSILMGMLEITIGINQICSSTINIHTKIVLVTVITSFGGLSGMAQTKSVLADTRLSMKKYLWVKLLNALITFALVSIYLFYSS